jgi:hypothetical protein
MKRSIPASYSEILIILDLLSTLKMIIKRLIHDRVGPEGPIIIFSQSYDVY